MSLDDAINAIQTIITTTSASAQIKVVKMSDEEARLTVLVPAADMQKVKDATFMPAMNFLNNDGFDLQVQVYDKDAPPLSA